jgi:hypothetical protein
MRADPRIFSKHGREACFIVHSGRGRSLTGATTSGEEPEATPSSPPSVGPATPVRNRVELWLSCLI